MTASLVWDRSGCRERVCVCHDDSIAPQREHTCSLCGCRATPLAGGFEGQAWSVDEDYVHVYEADSREYVAEILGNLSQRKMRSERICAAPQLLAELREARALLAIKDAALRDIIVNALDKDGHLQPLAETEYEAARTALQGKVAR